MKSHRDKDKDRRPVLLKVKKWSGFDHFHFSLVDVIAVRLWQNLECRQFTKFSIRQYKIHQHLLRFVRDIRTWRKNRRCPYFFPFPDQYWPQNKIDKTSLETLERCLSSDTRFIMMWWKLNVGEAMEMNFWKAFDIEWSFYMYIFSFTARVRHKCASISLKLSETIENCMTIKMI